VGVKWPLGMSTEVDRQHDHPHPTLPHQGEGFQMRNVPLMGSAPRSTSIAHAHGRRALSFRRDTCSRRSPAGSAPCIRAANIPRSAPRSPPIRVPACRVHCTPPRHRRRNLFEKLHRPAPRGELRLAPDFVILGCDDTASGFDDDEPGALLLDPGSIREGG